MVRCMGEIGTVLRQAREGLGESQADLSYRMRVPASTISRHEQGQQDPTAASIHGYDWDKYLADLPEHMTGAYDVAQQIMAQMQERS